MLWNGIWVSSDSWSVQSYRESKTDLVGITWFAYVTDVNVMEEQLYKAVMQP